MGLIREAQTAPGLLLGLPREPIKWCDCAGTTLAISADSHFFSDGSFYHLTCGGWIFVTTLQAKCWGLPQQRPRDRIQNIAPHITGVKIALEERQYDGFCTPCGGFRTHRRGCPVRK